ncbi:MAG: hypothetical protein C4584_02325 [Armatimonadetes bacterium]|nr:MAG: hypothetical protein C4584_02325 [Armatimonadota bacterium]
MNKSFGINLLPQEVLVERQHGAKLNLVNKISVTVLVAMVFLTSLVITVQLSQNSQLKKVKGNLVYAEGKVIDLKSKEGQVITLKNRLGLIQSFSKDDAKRKEVFNLVVYLMPLQIQINELSLDKSGYMTISLSSSSLSAIDELIVNLGNQEKNAGMISKVSLENLSLGREGKYNFVLKITPV